MKYEKTSTLEDRNNLHGKYYAISNISIDYPNSLLYKDIQERRYKHAVFNIHQRTILYNNAPIALSVRVTRIRVLKLLDKFKVRNYTVDRRSAKC